ncbi:Hypothetical protein, putative [Bodo saltans]|uniref:Uncharacterized protein n=1 Tax=Bodo saltans TaxID=75058 RepID=A0A0S4IUQ8_BODSA|nr:Hypothetical protein, putative [Bodo saltans]|eukprot:CUF40440.1 Hypothetical protein, putative [Bodo saltans]
MRDDQALHPSALTPHRNASTLNLVANSSRSDGINTAANNVDPPSTAATQKMHHGGRDDSILPLTADEVDYLSHFFYHQIPSGRVQTEDELAELLLRANITVPPIVLTLFHDQFGGPDGVLCEEFLDMCAVVKTMDILLLSSAITNGPDRNNDEQDEESRELFGLFTRLQQAEVESSIAHRAHQHPVNDEDTEVVGGPNATVGDTSSNKKLLSAVIPSGALEAIRSRRNLLERLAAQGSANVSHQNTPRVGGMQFHTHHHNHNTHHLQHQKSSNPRLSPQDSQVIDHTVLPILQAYDDAFTSIAGLGKSAEGGPTVNDPARARSSSTFDVPRQRQVEDTTRKVEVDGIARRPKPANVLVAALILIAESSSEVPGGSVHHWAIKNALSSFGLLDDEWDATRSLDSIGCAVDDDYFRGGAEGVSSGGALFVDTTLYIPLNARRFRELLKKKQMHSIESGQQARSPSPQSAHQSPSRVKSEGMHNATSLHRHLPDESHDDLPDLLDVDDDMDGVENIMREIHAEASRMRRRSRRADDSGVSSGALFVDTTLYIPLNARRFRELLKKKQMHSIESGQQARSPSPQSAHQSPSRVKSEGMQNATSLHRRLPDESHDNLPDLLDIDDDMDGVENIMRDIHAEASRMRRRSRRADDSDDDDDDAIDAGGGSAAVRYVEDPLTGEVHTSALPSSSHGRSTATALTSDEVSAMAAVESDLFLSPQRRRRIDEVREFLMTQTVGGSTTAAGTPHPHYHSARDSVTATTARKTPPPSSIALFPPSEVLVPPAAVMSLKKSQHQMNDDDESGRAATPDDNSMMMSTARRNTMLSSMTGFPGSPSAAGGGGGRSHFLASAPGVHDQGGAASASSATGTAAAHRVHPLHHKLRQIILRRLQRLREHFSQHPFPVSRKANVRTGLTPTALPLFPRRFSKSAGETSAVFSLEPNDSTFMLNKSSANASALRQTSDEGKAQLAALDFMLNKSSANASALRQTSDEGKAQLAALDDAFPPCDMSYAEFYFVPQLKRAPRGGVPLHVAHRTATPKRATLDDKLNGSGQVVPGLYSDTPARIERRYRTAVNVSDGNNMSSASSSISVMKRSFASPLAQTHNKQILLHSYLSPQALIAQIQRSTKVDDSIGWVSRLSANKGGKEKRNTEETSNLNVASLQRRQTKRVSHQSSTRVRSSVDLRARRSLTTTMEAFGNPRLPMNEAQTIKNQTHQKNIGLRADTNALHSVQRKHLEIRACQ